MSTQDFEVTLYPLLIDARDAAEAWRTVNAALDAALHYMPDNMGNDAAREIIRQMQVKHVEEVYIC